MFDPKKIPGSRDLYFFSFPALRKQLEARFFFESKIASVSTIADLRFFSALWREKKDGKEGLVLREVFKNLVLEELDLVR